MGKSVSYGDTLPHTVYLVYGVNSYKNALCEFTNIYIYLLFVYLNSSIACVGQIILVIIFEAGCLAPGGGGDSAKKIK